MFNNIYSALEQLGLTAQKRAIHVLFSNESLNSKVFLQYIEGVHTLNDGLHATLICLSTDVSIPLKQFIGAQVAVDTVTDKGILIRQSGIITGADVGQSDGSLTLYKLEMQDATSLFKHRRNSRVFMNKSVKDIVQLLFAEWKEKSPLFASSITLDMGGLTKEYDIRPFVMQHNQTDWEFLTNLLRSESINWLIDEAQLIVPNSSAQIQAQKLRLIDDNAQYQALERRKIKYHRSSATETKDSITSFIGQRSLQPTSVYINRWQADALDMDEGAGSVLTTQKHSKNYDSSSLGLEDAWHFTPAWMQDLKGEDGATASGNRQVEKINQNLSNYHNSQAKQFVAKSTVRDTQVGYWFELHDHPEIDLHADADKEFLITSKSFYNQNNLPKDLTDQVDTLLSQSQWNLKNIAYSDERQGNQLILQRRNISVVPEYNPLEHRAKAYPQRAKVVGPAGEEIHVDEWGRIKVRFLFTRNQDNSHDGGAGSNDNDTDSAWVDVVTPWAGEGYGARFLPRIGEIVVVDFMDGNIDRPFVIGRLHEAQRSPTKFDAKGQLPDTKKLSGIRSKEVDGEGFNQLRFDDTTGQISAQLQSSHGATQLNLGNLSHPKESATSDGRGDGFELRTDNWGSVRAPKGILITTEGDDEAFNHQMVRAELESALLAAQSNNENIQQLAKSHKAQEPDLEIQKKINQDIPKWDGSDETPFIVLHSNDHFVVNSLKGTLIQSADHIEISTNRNVQTYTGNNVLTNALGSISLFAQQKDIDVKAGHGNVNVQAQSGEVTLASQQLMHLYALNDLVKIESGKGILIASGGGYIKIEGGNIDIVCPGKISLKAGQICTMPGSSLTSDLAQMPQAQASYDEQFIVRNRAGIIQPNVKYKLVTEDGKTITGITDAEGKTEKISSLSMVKAELTILGRNDD